MRKLLLTLMATLVTFSIVASCTKSDENPLGDYVCHCDITSSSGTHAVDIPLNGKTKADAVTTCANTETTYNSSGNTATCNLQ